MSTFDEISRKIIVESSTEQYGIVPEFVLDSWLRSRYRRVVDKIPYGSINKHSDVVIITEAMYNTGTVDVTQGSIALTGHDTVFTINMIGQYIRIGQTRGWYMIADFVDAGHLTLDAPWADTSRSGSGYFIAKRFYTLPEGVRWVIDCKNVSRAIPLSKLHIQKLDEMFPDRIATPGVPLHFSPVRLDPFTGRRIIEIYPFANINYRLEFSGYANVEDPGLDNSPIPDIDDRVLIEGGLADAFNFRAGKETTREMIYGMLNISKVHEVSFDALMSDLAKRDSLDAPSPRINLLIQKRDLYGIRDPLTNAEQEVFNRPPQFG